MKTRNVRDRLWLGHIRRLLKHPDAAHLCVSAGAIRWYNRASNRQHRKLGRM